MGKLCLFIHQLLGLIKISKEMHANLFVGLDKYTNKKTTFKHKLWKQCKSVMFVDRVRAINVRSV